MYEQTLYKVLPNYIKQSVIKQQNRYSKWKYGYNKEYDVIIISKTGKIGEIYEIQNLRIALPLIDESFKRSAKKEEQYWEQLKIPKELEKIKSVFDWNKYPDSFKEKWYDYVDRGSLNTIEDVAAFIADMLSEQAAGKLPFDLCFFWDSVGSIPCRLSVESNKNNNEWNAGAMSQQFG